MMSPFEQAALLGALQGLTEFLPISSSGHLALAQTLFGIEDAGLTLTVVLHAGTLVATLVYFRKRILEILVDLAYSLRQGRLPVAGAPGRDALVVVVASIPTGILGLTLHETVAEWTQQPLATGFGFIVTGLLLLSSLWTRPGTVLSPTLWLALAVGLAQGIAIFPGISRSGSTIVVALWLGIRSDRAFELSMLLSVPAIVGALLLELLGAKGLDGHALPLLLGAMVSFFVGLVALSLLRRAVSRGHLAWFSLWVLPVALATLALARAWPS
jgi:undecaprenyl-diphosphatase